MNMKRILAFALVLVMTLGLLPLQALAENNAADDYITLEDYCRENGLSFLCGLEAHTHDESCSKVICGQEEAEAHTHVPECYSTEKTELVCTSDTIIGHVHTEECKTGLLCSIPENHTHSEACYAAVIQSLCEIPLGHDHGEGCFEMTTEYACENTEEGHVHDDTCPTVQVPTENVVCEIPENHVHDASCPSAQSYSDEPSCGIEAGHTHSEGCYGTSENYLCGEVEITVHTHDETCYTYPLTCGKTETTGHTHSDACYELACEKEEHSYVAECLPGTCQFCGQITGHLEDCVEYVCPICMEQGGHKENCLLNNEITENCPQCGQETGHAVECPQYVRGSNYTINETYKGVGPLLGGNTQVMMFSANPFALGIDEESEDTGTNSNGTLLDSVDMGNGLISGTKAVYDTGLKTQDGDPIMKIKLDASSVSQTTGQSCDFVLILDMSYSMSTPGNLDQLKLACHNFVSELFKLSKYSRVAIVTYGGDKKANSHYYIETNDQVLTATSPITSGSNSTAGYSLALKDKSSSINENQLWSVEYYTNRLPGGPVDGSTRPAESENDVIVKFRNVGTGQVMDVSSGHATSNGITSNVTTWHQDHETNGERWKLIPLQSGMAMYLSPQVLYESGAVTSYYLYSDGNRITINSSKNKAQTWTLTPAYAPEYETYYWTNNADPDGYGVQKYTDDSYAATAFLTISENDEGDKINTKLTNAIDALTAYGEPQHGSNPGDAVEKAARIYDAVKEDDICGPTGFPYIDNKRGVLFFADGTPTPSDEVKLDSYNASSSNTVLRYKKYYDFEPTYVDAQNALNWSHVLKADQYSTIDKQEIYEGKGFYGGIPTESQWPDITEGCGATLYSLSINLESVDVTQCDGANHPDLSCDRRDVLIEDGSYVNICLNKVLSKNAGGMNGSFASASNEFFYRFSSHDKLSWHITTLIGTKYEGLLSTAQIQWDDLASGWNQKYPDFLCRNQVGSYFVACNKSSELAGVFADIAIQTGKKLENLTMTDNVTMPFVIADANGTPVSDGTRIQLDGTVIPADDPDPAGLFGVVNINEDLTYSIKWVNFDLDPGSYNDQGQLVGTETFSAEFYIVPRDGFLGGNQVPSNNGAYITDKNDAPVVKYDDPEVDVNISESESIEYEVDARAGSTYLEHIPYSEILKLVYFKIKDSDDDTTNDVYLQLGVDNYGREAWMTEFVNIQYKLYDSKTDADGNMVDEDDSILPEDGTPVKATELKEGDQLEIRRTRKVIAELYIWPKEVNAEGEHVTADTIPENLTPVTGYITLSVYYPTFVFSDMTLYHGQPLELATEVWGEKMDATNYLYWYTNAEYETLLTNPNKSDENPKGYEPLPKGSWGTSGDVIIQETPEVYFIVDPIDQTVDNTTKTEPVDEKFYTKFDNHMGKEPVAMNVRVFFTNKDDPEYDPNDPPLENAMRNAFFLHVNDRTTTLPKHKSGSATNDTEYWGPEFFINPAYCQLTIEKTGGLPNETYVFTISRGLPNEYGKDANGNRTVVIQKETAPTYYTSVSITTDANGNGSVTLTELPVGVYTVAEDMDWSWRFKTEPRITWAYASGADKTYQNAAQTAFTTDSIYLLGNAEQDSATVTVTNSKPVDTWLSGMSSVVTNVFGKKTG